MTSPRELGSELDGYAHLPRMLDKARATLSGTQGDLLFGCPVDHTCMARLGVSPELVLELAGRYPDDRQVLEKLREHGIPSAEDAWFDAEATEDELQERGYLWVRRRDALPDADGGRVFAGAGVDAILIEIPPGETHGPRVASAAEVWLIEEGQSTFNLGEHQARVVSAGEVARVPAGVEHSCRNTGSEVLRMVVVHRRDVRLGPWLDRA